MAVPDLRNKLDYNEEGVIGTATKDSTTDHDMKITDDNIFITGGEILFKDAEWGDYIVAQVVDKDNVLGGGAGVVLNEYIHKRYVHPDLKRSAVNIDYAGNVPKNLYLRIKYTSVGTTNDVKVAINYHLHKVL